MSRHATVYVDYQQRASEFAVGDLAYPLAGGATDESQAGRVVAVYPGIGQVDIEFPWGSGRYPVEDVQRVTGVAAKPPHPDHSSVPGGVGTTGMRLSHKRAAETRKAIDRLAHAWVKRSLYWASKDRHYQATAEERESGKYTCPRCKKNRTADGDEGDLPFLRPTSYKRVDGQSHHLLGCPSCLFLIKQEHIIGDDAYDALSVADEAGEDLPSGWAGHDQVLRTRQAVSTPPERVLTVTFSGQGDGAESMAKMLAYIGKIGGIGHSFGVVVDPENSEFKRQFGFDGDGSDRILSVELDGDVMEAD